MLDSVAEPPRCESCGHGRRPDSRFCPNCGYSSEARRPGRAASEPIDRAMRFDAHWGEIKRVGLLFSSVLFASFVAGLFSRSFAGPRVQITVTGLIALLAVPFAVPHDREILALLKLPSAERRDSLEMLGVSLMMVVLLSGYFATLRWLGIPLIHITASFVKSAWPVWSIYLAISVLPAIIEELTFRGVIQTSLEQVVSRRDAWLIQAALFSILHLLPAMFPSHFAMGLCFGFLRNKSKSLYPGMMLHAAWNALAVYNELHAR